jgi:carboxymethylenebutenolidase
MFMRRSALIAMALSLMLSAHAGFAQQHEHGTSNPAVAYTARGHSVTFNSSPGEAMGYLSLPADKTAKHPALIVIQEWWGLNDWIKEQSDRFAGQGYVALAVDLYRGKVANDQALAHELSRGLPEDRAINDLKAGVDYLSARADVDSKRIGVIGWCMGGGYALGLATVDPRIAATVINYGRLVTDPVTIGRINAPVLGNFGGEDRGIAPADVKTFEAALIKAHKSADVKIYGGAGHAFMNPGNKTGYVAAAAKDAQRRIDGFFARYLRR